MPTYRLGTPEYKAYMAARKDGKSVEEATAAAEKAAKPAAKAAAAKKAAADKS